MPTDLSKYSDVHTHNPDAGSCAIINLPWGIDVPRQGSYSVGIHPWQAAAATEADYQRLSMLAADKNVVAIGETGLDALRGGPIDTQIPAFIRHIEVSEATQKPLIIHAVRTINQIIALHKGLRPTQTWVIHGFRGKPEQAKQLIREGIHISLGHKFNPLVPDAVPAHMLHHETDCQQAD